MIGNTSSKKQLNRQDWQYCGSGSLGRSTVALMRALYGGTWEQDESGYWYYSGAAAGSVYAQDIYAGMTQDMERKLRQVQAS